MVKNMELKKQLEDRIIEMEQVSKAFNIEPFDIYFLGGSACILGGYTDRATRDFDFVDLDYPSKLGMVFVHLRDFDMLEYNSTILSPYYKDRAKKLEKFTYLNVYILSAEDIIISKIIRLEDKDFEDIDELIRIADKNKLRVIIDEVLNRDDLYDSKKAEFIKKLKLFKERYNV